MRRVGFLYNPRVEASQRLAQELVRVVEEFGLEPWVQSAWEKEEIFEQAGHCNLLVTLGGDGTILRVARASLGSPGQDGRRATPPLLTIDFGTLGFLAELKPEEAAGGLRRLLQQRDYWLEERWLLHAALLRQGALVAEREALNDVVLARGDGPHAIRLTLSIDGAETARYTADAMIVASPTGSTAYALGAGGPIMAPDVAGILVVPVAPHLAVARGFVVPATSCVTLEASAYKATVVTIDGQVNLSYEEGDQLQVTRSSTVARFVRLGAKNYFYATLESKLKRG